MEKEITLVYSIKLFNGGVSFYYPEAFLASTKNGNPEYFKKTGSYEVIESYGIVYNDNDHEKLLKICLALNPLEIENTFQKKNGKRQSLSQLFEVDIVKSSIQKKIDLGLHTFIKIIKQNGYPLYFDPRRKVHLDNCKIKFSPFLLQPLLRFEKTVTGTNYYFYLRLEENVASPKDMAILLLSQNPAIILQNNTIFEIENFDGKKIIPFLEKSYIHIPARITHDYFTKFIKDIIAKVDVEVEGFEYQKIDVYPKALLKFSSGFTEDNYEAIPIFQYGEVRFIYGDKQKYKVNIDINEQNEVKVTQVNRNFEAEEKYLTLFEELSYQKTAAFRFKLESDDPYHSLLNSIKNEKLFIAQGWQIFFPEINQKKINLDDYSIKEAVTALNDWFDIHAVVEVGNQHIPFTSLIHHIKKNNRLYILKDGTLFIIPLEWMQKYEMLARFGEADGDKIRISKANYTIIDELGIESHGPKPKAIISESDFEFELPSSLHATLRPYQYDGAKWLVKHYKNNMGACLADDMGLGKTLQALTLLCHVKETLGDEIVSSHKSILQLSLFDTYNTQRRALQTLIVVPASLIFNWEREIKKFAPSLMVKAHSGTDRTKDYKGLVHFDIILTSYPIALKDYKLLECITFEYIIIDEAHYIKNRDSKIFKALNTFKAKNKISLSGTPIENSLADLWSQMQFINPDILLSYTQFKKMYQDPIEKEKDEKAIQELKKMLHPFILRRTKKEVLTDLPESEEQIYYCTMDDDQRSLVEAEKSKARNTLLNAIEEVTQNKIHVFNALMRLRQLANHPRLVDEDSSISSCKYEEVTNTIDTLVKGDNKVLIFSTFLGQLDIYRSYLETNKIGYSMLTGASNAKQRAKAVDDFQNNEDCRVMLISITAGNTGLNLTAANYVILLDPWWNPFIEEQAKGRAHRIGQLREVTFIKFITKDTIEEKILSLQERKLKLSMDFMDERSMPEFDRETLGYLLS